MVRKFSLLYSFLILLTVNASAKKYVVNTELEFEKTLELLLPGDKLVIANGSYESWSVNINSKGSAKHPITIEAQDLGKVVFTGKTTEPIFRITGSYVSLKGIVFQDCQLVKNAGKSGVLIEINNGANCTVSTCRFIKNRSTAQFMPLVIIAGNGSNNRIEKCIFDGNIDSQDLQVKVTKEFCPQNTLITKNSFKNKTKVSWANGNGGECIQIGQDPILLGHIKANALVSRNTFFHCDGENEIISNKSSKNSYLNNIFNNNDGELVMRGGHDCLIKRNKFNGGTGGIRVNGTGHIVSENSITDIKTAIRLMYGMAKGKDEIGFYIAASNCSITNNTIRNSKVAILIGDSKNIDWTGKFDVKRYPSPVLQNVAPFENRIEGNKISDSEVRVLRVEP